MKSVVVPEGVITLGADRAFGSDKSLAEATLPTTIRTIGGWSFFEDPALKVVYIKAVTPPSLDTYAFGGSTNCVITVPDAAYNAYKNSSTWAAFNLMKEGEYSVNSGKIALLNYLSANEAAMNAAKGGSTPDVYPMDKYAPFGFAINNGQGIGCGQGYRYGYQALENSGFACINGQATDNNDTNSEQQNIVMKDSSYVSYLFSDKPKVVVNKDTLDVVTPVVELKLKMADVAYFCFGNVPEDITAIKEASITTSDNSPLVIYGIDGTQMR